MLCVWLIKEVKLRYFQTAVPPRNRQVDHCPSLFNCSIELPASLFPLAPVSRDPAIYFQNAVIAARTRDLEGAELARRHLGPRILADPTPTTMHCGPELIREQNSKTRLFVDRGVGVAGSALGAANFTIFNGQT